MARVAPQPEAFSKAPTGKISKPKKDGAYLAWLHQLPCIVTRMSPVEAAHISYAEPRYGKLGRGMARKESDRWSVPLTKTEHDRQHSMNEKAYWDQVGIDPCIVALALYGAYPDVEIATFIIQNIERKPRGVTHGR